MIPRPASPDNGEPEGKAEGTYIALTGMVRNFIPHFDQPGYGLALTAISPLLKIILQGFVMRTIYATYWNHRKERIMASELYPSIYLPTPFFPIGPIGWMFWHQNLVGTE
jgi:hypothetical protein